MNSKEGYIRFNTLNSLFLAELTNKSNKKHDQYLNIIIKQIAKYVKKDFPQNYVIITDLFLFEYPKIIQFNKGDEQKLILIKEFSS